MTGLCVRITIEYCIILYEYNFSHIQEFAYNLQILLGEILIFLGMQKHFFGPVFNGYAHIMDKLTSSMADLAIAEIYARVYFSTLTKSGPHNKFMVLQQFHTHIGWYCGLNITLLLHYSVSAAKQISIKKSWWVIDCKHCINICIDLQSILLL